MNLRVWSVIFLFLIAPEGLLPFSDNPAIGLSSELDEFGPPLTSYTFNIRFNIIAHEESTLKNGILASKLE
jgi:hypothetical protein